MKLATKGTYSKIPIFSIMPLIAAVLLSSCGKPASEEVKQNSFGLSLVILSGNNQLGAPDKLFAQPLRVLVMNASGEGVQDIGITFTETTTTDLLVTSPSPITGSDGTAQTSVRAPLTYDQASVIKACIKDSPECVNFRLRSDFSSQNIKLVLETENDSNEVAGVPFQLVLRTLDATDDHLVDIDEDVDLEWTFITASSWSGIAPTNVPVTTTCTFVDGVCTLPTPVTLTDARVTTKVFVGDGDGGYVDVFAKLINVAPNDPESTVITDKLGGPANGAVTISDTVFTTDNADFTFYAAITDIVGNYISDPTNAVWSSTHPLEVTANLSTTNGVSTTLHFQQTVPFPNFATITASVPPYTAGVTGKISIDPGVPANVELVPKDDNYTRLAGVPFEFDFRVTDAKDNIVGQKFGSTGFTGTFPVTVTFSNYWTPPTVSGGKIPILQSVGMSNTEPLVTKTFTVPFYGGKAQFISREIIFWDATGVAPRVDVSIDTTLETVFPNVTGSTDYNVAMDMDPLTWHIMPRVAAGASAEPLCKAEWRIWGSTTLPSIIDVNYLAYGKGMCDGLEVRTDDPPVTMYGAIEDRAGNFIANIDLDYITTDPLPSVVPSDFEDLLSHTTGPFSIMTPTTVTGDLNENRWIKLKGTYLGNPYETILLGEVDPGQIKSIELRVLHALALGNKNAVASVVNTIIVVPKDANGNEIEQSFDRWMDVSYSGTVNNGLDGTPAVFLTTGPQELIFDQFTFSTADNINDTTAHALLPNLKTPRVGDVINVTVTDLSDPSITATLPYTVIPGPANSMKIYKGADYPAGVDVTDTDFTVTTDESLIFYSVLFDTHLNRIAPDPTLTSWDTTLMPFVPANAVSGMFVLGSLTPFIPDIPSAGILQATKINTPLAPVIAKTGTITIVPGVPRYIDVTLPSYNVTAGAANTVTATIRDNKDNQATQINGPTNIAISVLANDETRKGYDHSAPTTGTYNFTAGQYIFTGAEAFSFYNSLFEPRIQISTTDSSPIVGQSMPVAVDAAPFDHLALLSEFNIVDAGDLNIYEIVAEDLYGNKIDSSNQNVTFTISSSLGEEDITASDLASASISDFSLPNQKVINGNLTAGSGHVTVKSNKAGILTVDGDTLGIIGANTEEPLTVEPLTAVTNIRFKPGSEPAAIGSAISQLYPFTVEALDLFDNVITSNSSDQIQLELIGASMPLGNYNPQTLAAGATQFSNLTYTKAESFTLRAKYAPDVAKYVEAPMTIQMGSVTRTVAILPNQTWTEGQGNLAAAVTGTPFTTGNVTAGTSFNVEVRAVDNAYNTVTTYTGSVSLESTDPYLEVTPSSQNFAAGVATFSVKVRKQGAVHTITAVTGFTDNASTAYSVGVAPATQLITILPSQTHIEGAPDLATAQSGVVPDQTAGVAFTATVKAVDDYYNQVTTFNHASIGIAFNSDPSAPAIANKAMAGGSVSFNLTGYKAIPNHTVTPSTIGGTSLTSRVSSNYRIIANSATQFIAVFPGQTHNSGKAPGDYAAAVTGTPTDQTTDLGFSVNVYAVDAYFNVRLDYGGTVTLTTPSDPSDTAPTSANGGNFVSGAETFTINPVKAADNQSITVTATGLSSNTPATYNVKPGSPAKLIAIFPDYQTLNEGSSTLAGALSDVTVQNRTAGSAVNVRVYATDAEYNVVNSTASVSISSSTANTAITPPSQNLVAGTALFSLTTYLAGSGYVVNPAGTGFSIDASTAYNVTLSAGKKLLTILPGQTFIPGKSLATDAASGTPYKQTMGSDFPFTATVIATDDYFNKRTADTDSVTLSSTLGSSITTNPKNLVAGETTFTLYNTASGTAATISGTAAGFTTVASKAYDVISTLADPTLSLADGTTGSTSYIRQTLASATIASDATATYWCLSDVQITRPTTGTNGRTTCTGGVGTDMNWHTSRPTTFTTSAGQGSKTVYLWTADAANNVSVNAVTDAITLDSVVPTNPSAMSLADISSGSLTYTDIANVNLNVTLSGDTTQWCLKDQTAVAGAPSAPLYNDGCWQNAPGSFPDPYSMAAQGNRTVYVFAKDAAQNVSASYASASINYDGTAPTFPAGAILGARAAANDVTADAYLGTSLTPIIAWQAATDSTTVTYSVLIKDSALVDKCGGAQTTTSLSYNFSSCTLTDGETYTVYLTATDSAGNSTTADNNGFAFTVDVTAPGAFTVTGMDGGADVTVDSWLTDNLTSPRLNWNDTSGESNYYAYIYTTGDVLVTNCSGTAAANATSFSGFVGCTLADNTSYKMRVRATDAAGNITEASNSPLTFQTSKGVNSFQVELVPATDPVAGQYFAVKATAYKLDGNIDTSFTGSKAVSWSSTAATTATDVCSSGQDQNREFASLSLTFTAGVGTTLSTFAMKKAETGRTITITSAGKSGTSAAFNVVAAAQNCVRIETAAGGSGSALGSQSPAIDATVNAFAVGRDAYGNYTGNVSVNWSGTGALVGLPILESGTSTTVVAAKAGSGTLVASGGLAAVNFTVGTGNVTWTTANDADGKARLASNNTNAVFYYNVSNDTASTAWRSASSSWRDETAGTHRGSRANFPTEAILVGSNSGLDILDASTNKLYMRFQSGANYAIDNNFGNIVDIAALNGKIYVSMNDGATAGSLIIIDLVNDQVYQTNNSTQRLSANNIANRNSSATWNANATYPALANNVISKLHVRNISGVDYLAIAESNAVELMRTSGTATIYSDTTSNAVKAVHLASDSKLYYAEDNVGVHRADLGLPLAGNFTPSRTYGDVYPTAGYHFLNLTFNDLAVAEGVSSADSGKHTLVVANSVGLSVIHEHGTDGSETSVVYSKSSSPSTGATAMFAGTSENVKNIDLINISGLVTVHLVTSNGWMELRNIQGTVAQFTSDTSIVPSDIKIFHADAYNDNDPIISLTTAGVHLKRR